jgi:hypothetical protein
MWRWLIPLAVACAVAFGLVWAGQRQATHLATATATNTDPKFPAYTKPCGFTGTPPTTYKHVIWIMFGSRGYKNVIGKHTSALYLNSLAAQCGLATGYRSVTHPTLPNVVAAVTGSTGTFAHNECPGCRTSAPNLFKQVPSWAVYMASMPSPCRATDAIPAHYLARMNPAVYLSSVECRRFDLPLGGPNGAFAHRLARGRLPAFTMIVPDECHSMTFNNDCGVHKVGDFVALGDVWLQGWMRQILQSPAYRNGQTAVLITWAEGTPAKPIGLDCLAQVSETCHVATLVVAPTVRAGEQVQVRLSHYSLLRTTEMLLGVTRYLGRARTAAGMRTAFHL